LHRALYPEYYGEDGQPIIGALRTQRRQKQPTKPIDSKWEPVMKHKSVNHGLSMYNSSVPFEGYLCPIILISHHIITRNKTAVLISSHRPPIRRPHLQAFSPQHQEILPQPRRSRNCLANDTPRPHRCTNPPLRKRQPRVRARRRHPPCAPTHRRPLRWRMHQHSAPGCGHRYPSTWPADPCRRRDVV
jgi:hypothetical protein